MEDNEQHWAPPFFILLGVVAGCAAALSAPVLVAHYLWVHL
jgi:uncharacterized membrane protein